jgi:hypothetical protein
MRRRKAKDVGLGAPRQVRFQRDVEREINRVAKLNGLDFPSALRMAARIGLGKLREGCITKEAP